MKAKKSATTKRYPMTFGNALHIQKSSDTFWSFWSTVLIFSLIFPFTSLNAFADGSVDDQFNKVCKQSLAAYTNGTGANGDILLAQCMQADLAKSAKEFETAKSVLYGVALGVTGAAEITGLTAKATVQTASTTLATKVATITAAVAPTDAACISACVAKCGPAAEICAAGCSTACVKGGADIATYAAMCSPVKASCSDESSSAGTKACTVATTTCASDAAIGLTGNTLMTVASTGATAGITTPPIVAINGANASIIAANKIVSTTHAVCKVTAAVATAGGLAISADGIVTINGEAKQYQQSKDSLMTFSSDIMMPTIGALGVGLMGTKMASEMLKSKELQDPCVQSLAAMGFLTTTSIMAAEKAKKAEQTATQQAATTQQASSSTVNNLGGGSYNITNPGSGGPTNPVGGSNPNNKKATVSGCSSQSGSAYLTCLGTISPEIAAMTASPGFTQAVNNAMPNTNLGDFVKNYQGNTQGDLGNYIAGGLGMNPQAMNTLLDKSAQAMKDSGLLDKYVPLTYKSGAGSAPKLGGEDMDFNKMMAGLLSKINPEAKDTAKASDPSERVFNQMDLLPAEKIYANKDISLFARIAFRYRKNTQNVDQLNWATSQNQK